MVSDGGGTEESCRGDLRRMNGLDLCRRYYEAYGAPMLREKFPELIPLLAVGLAGSGSECLGFDDGVSEDHDFDAGFCIWH